MKEADHRRWIGKEEAAQRRFPQKVKAYAERMLAFRNRNVVFKLPLLLECILRHVRVGAHRQIGERQVRHVAVRRN